MKSLFVTMLLTLLFAQSAVAAQLGTIIVDEARVHEYPREDSNVVSTVSKDQNLAVSNLPTEGFYKVRLSTGELGWISGNDIFVGAKPVSAPRPLPTPQPEGEPRAKPAKRAPKKPVKVEEATEESDFAGDDSRILLMFGIHSPSLGGFTSQFDATGLTPTYGLVLEFQFKINKYLMWVPRAEFNSRTVDNKTLSTTETQSLKQSSIPLMLGLQFSPYTTRDLRFGVGAYLGMALASRITVIQASTASNTEAQVDYSSVDPIGMINAQLSYGISTHTALVIEGGYRYQKSGDFASTQLLGTKEPFSIDYSGVVFHGGIEFRF